MPILKSTIHAIASMIILVLGAIIADVIKRNVELFDILADATVYLLLSIGNVPVSEEIAGMVLPFGFLMGLWILVYELKTVTK